MENSELILSTLPKTWIFDLDGTLFIHNGHLNGRDIPIQSSIDFVRSLPDEDYVVILTSRTDEYREVTLKALKENEIHYNEIIFNVPVGERIVVNDEKPSGLKTAYAINLKRDIGVNLHVTRNPDNYTR